MAKQKTVKTKKLSAKFYITIAIALAVVLIESLTIFGPQKIEIINMHEHMQNMDDVKVYLESTEPLGITKTLLLGSANQTLIERGGFTGYVENNDNLLKIKEAYPDKFEVLCTTYWLDPDQVKKAEECWKRGGKGVKLYNGHGSFYELPLDHENMLPLYKFIEDNELILLIHVNGGKYMKEFKEILDAYPKMKVICPHFCLISNDLNELAQMMEKYPNLYTDTSFGYIDYTVAGFKRMSKNVEAYQKFMQSYKDRVFFGADQIITNVKTRTHGDYIENTYDAYLKILTSEGFHFKIDWPKKHDVNLNGLNLSDDILESILNKAPQKLLDSTPEFKSL